MNQLQLFAPPGHQGHEEMDKARRRAKRAKLEVPCVWLHHSTGRAAKPLSVECPTCGAAPGNPCTPLLDYKASPKVSVQGLWQAFHLGRWPS